MLICCEPYKPINLSTYNDNTNAFPLYDTQGADLLQFLTLFSII